MSDCGETGLTLFGAWHLVGEQLEEVGLVENAIRNLLNRKIVNQERGLH